MKTRYIACAVLLAPFLAQADSPSSPAYAIAGDVIGAGGRRTSSAMLVNDGVIGGIGGVASAAAALTVKHGFAGQLLEVTNLSLSATPPTIHENGTRQLAVALAYDDGTFSAAPASVAWQVSSGPISGISAGGVATAMTVYEDTPAMIRASSGNLNNVLGLTVLNTNIDNFGSYAGDHIDDAWQVQFFGLNNPAARPGADPDGDGQTNFFEYVATTLPTDAQSRFRLSVSNTPLAHQKAITFSPRSPTRTYTPERRDSLGDGSFQPFTGAILDAGSTRTITDTNATSTNRFYRVRIELP
jgi:hypothetical protein